LSPPAQDIAMRLLCGPAHQRVEGSRFRIQHRGLGIGKVDPRLLCGPAHQRVEGSRFRVASEVLGHEASLRADASGNHKQNAMRWPCEVSTVISSFDVGTYGGLNSITSTLPLSLSRPLKRSPCRTSVWWSDGGFPRLRGGCVWLLLLLPRNEPSANHALFMLGECVRL
jgi:hypothetical protein